jgi:hypothetical protein
MYRCSQKAEKEINVDGKRKKVRVVNTSIYFRRAGPEEEISVFIMFRDNNQEEGERKVHVLFNRTLDEDDVNSLSELNRFTRTHLNIQRWQYYAFVDGPNHSETYKTLNGKYDYFCTSGGIPMYTNQKLGKGPLLDLEWLVQR